MPVPLDAPAGIRPWPSDGLNSTCALARIRARIVDGDAEHGGHGAAVPPEGGQAGGEPRGDRAPRRGRADHLYRHFPGKDDLVEAVLDAVIDDVIAAVRTQAQTSDDPRAAFRAAFTSSCDLSERDVATFAALASVSPRTDAHALAPIGTALGPVTTRLAEGGGLRPGITVRDIARFVLMTVSTGEPDTQRKAIEVLLAGLVV